MSVLVPLAALFALSGGRPVPSPRPAIVPELNACAAVTRADVELALGRKFQLAESQSGSRESACDYASGEGRVSVTMQRLGGNMDIAAEIKVLREAFPEGTVRETQGLGERAYFLDLPGSGTQLHVLRGRDYLMISVLGFGEPARVSGAAEGLARKVLNPEAVRRARQDGR